MQALTSRFRMRFSALLLAGLFLSVARADALPQKDLAASLASFSGSISLEIPVRRTLPLLGTRPADAPLLLADASLANEKDQGRAVQRQSGRVVSFIRALTHRPKVVSAPQAAALIKAGDHVFLPVGLPTSNLVLKSLSDRAKAPGSDITPDQPVKIVGLCNSAARSVFDRNGCIVHRSLFLGANARDPVAGGLSSFVPTYFSRVPRLIREGKVPVDVALLQVSKPDRLGFVTLGPTAADTLAALDKAKVVIAQVNGEMPRTRGATKIHISKLDYVVNANEPLPTIPAATISEVDRQIARHVVDLVLKKDSSQKPGLLGRTWNKVKNAVGCGDLPSFQFGIGGIPDAVAQGLAASPELSTCKVRSELIGPGTQKLVESGKVQGKVLYTFAMGDKDFLKWMDKNRKLKAKPVDELNDPHRIGKINNVVAINSAIAVDLNGQVNAQYVKGEWYSGVGGQVDFMRGAMNSKGGKAIIALPSVAEVSDGKGGKKLISKIVPHLGEGDVVTTNMHDVQHVVTEHGVASLEGKTDVERARALIQIAHPDFRQELTRALDAQIEKRSQGEQRRYDQYQAAKRKE
jgi:4-hydroxybutyrate CoA-transferase